MWLHIFILLFGIFATIGVFSSFFVKQIKNSLYFRPNNTIYQSDYKLISNYRGQFVNIKNITAVYFKCNNRSKSNYIILHCHGNAGNMFNRFYLSNKFRKIKCDLLIFDYSGYGLSSGSTSEKQMYIDTQLCFNYLTSIGYAKCQIIMYGESIGCPIAIKIAIDNLCDKVILQSSVYSINQYIYDKFPKFISHLLTFFTKSDFRTDLYLEKYKYRCMLIHGTNDELFNPIHIVKFSELRPQIKLSLVYGDHNNLEIDWYQIHKFINS